MSETTPNWSPRWGDVGFDQVAAQEAAEACRHAARRLDDAIDASVGAAASAARDWQGQAQRSFEAAHTAWVRSCEAQIDDLHRSAAQIEGAADEARAAQRARERDRERWYAERRQLESRATAEVG